MTDKKFVHLHCHSHYSLLDGAGPIGKLISRAKEHGMNALALTDHGNLHGALEFYKKAKEAGINPIIGCEAYIAPGSRFAKEAGNMKEASYHLTLLAQNRTGFQNLIKLASKAALEGFYFKPRIDKELLAAHSEGIICLSGCVSSEFSRALLRGHGADPELKEAVETAQWFHKLFGNRYFIEIMNNGVEIQRIQLQAAVEVANRLGLPLVATSDTHYVDREDAEAQDVLLCINTGKFRTDTNRMKMDGNQYFLRTPAEMYACFPGLEAAVARSQEIADTVQIDLELGKRHFPTFTVPAERTADDYLRELCEKGLKERYADDPEMCVGGELAEVVRQRLDRELSCISKLGFSNYFLICWDFVRHAREQGVPATARGSGVGAIVCYALYLSHVCPLKYDLLFERFLDENRKEAPDIDIDFCKDRRGEIIRYVKEKYGEEMVAQIGTFGTLAAKAAIKDVGRALGVPLNRVNEITAMVPEELHITLEKALEKSEDLKKVYASDGEVREMLDLAKKIEGLARNVGTHAAAVVIADRPLTDYVPLGRVTGKTDIITQWAMGDVEAAGLLKMDFLGLRNLTILSKAVELIEQTTGKKVDPYKFPLDDKETFAVLSRGETKGIFQLESGGIRDLLQKMKPDHFRDIIATNALYRPGPLEGGMVDDYVAVKLGRKAAEYKHPVLKKILEETHGVMVYQEQVMRILNRLGGIDLAAAYTCIKAISKKKESIINANREQFIKGAVERGMSGREATEFWELIIKFAGYGFNKCVVGSTEVVHAQTGERITVQDLFSNSREFAVHALAGDGKLVPRQVTDVLWNGRKPVFELLTSCGMKLVATGNHPLKTLAGWKNLSELKPGDRIASPRVLNTPGRLHWPRHELIALAGLIAEGNVCHPTCLYYFNNDPVLIDDFSEAARQFADSNPRITPRTGRKNIEVCVSTGRDTKLKKGGRPWNAPSDEGGVATAVATKTRCGMYLWAESLGILGKRAREKFVPAPCFELCDEDLELFLGRLWSGDGFVGAANQMPYYATSSERLARDMQLLLLRLGIVSRIKAKIFRYVHAGERRTAPGWTVHLVGDQSVANFLRRVATHALGRESQVAAFREYVRGISPGQTSKDTIPAEVRAVVDEERRRLGINWRDLEQRSCVSMKEFVGRGSAKKRGFRRATIARLAEFFASERLRQAADSDIFWQSVVSIEPRGEDDTYDLTVDHDHNFVANGLIVHNSHSTAYALIAYMTAYLKAHYPLEFMGALLSGDIQHRNFKKKDQLVEHLEDCHRMGITVVPPNVNSSSVDFAVADGKILFALSAIKGCGGAAGEAIVAARKKQGPFKSIFDFCERVDPAACNRAAIETLVKAGAFDSLGARRSQMLAVIEKALQAGASTLADRRRGQKSLFGGFEEEETVAAPVNLPDLPELGEREKLAAEKEVLGYYLSSHPLAEHEETLAAFCTHTTADLGALRDRAEVMLGGMISSIKTAHTRNPKPGAPSKYANFDLEDKAGAIRCIMWPEDFAKNGHLIVADAILLVRGSLDRRGGDEANLIVNDLIPLDQASLKYTSGVKIIVDERLHGPDVLTRVREIVRGYPGDRELSMLLCLEDGSRVSLKSHRVRVEVNPELRRRLDDLLGPGNCQFLASRPAPKPPAENGRKYESQKSGGR